MAQDEGRFGRISTPQRACAPPVVRPKAKSMVIHQSSHVYAAVAPQQGLTTSFILPHADTEIMNLFLAHVTETFADYFIVIQVDQAGWHRAKDLKIPENLRLIFQPAYSPEVNPIALDSHNIVEFTASLLFSQINPFVKGIKDEDDP